MCGCVNTCNTLCVLTSVQRLCGIHGIGHSADQDKGSGGQAEGVGRVPQCACA